MQDLPTMVFAVANGIALLCWLPMIFAPQSAFTLRWLRRPWLPVPFAMAYLVLVAPRLASLLPLLVKPELAPVAALLGSPDGAVIAWLHLLAFDLFVGRWIVLDAAERGLPGLLTTPVLALTLLFGPIGFLGYLLGSAAFSKRA